MRDKNLYGISGLHQYVDAESFGLILNNVNARYNNALWRQFASWGKPTNEREWKQGVRKTPILVRASVLGTHSEKPQRSTQGWELYGGTLPKIGHGFSIDQDDLIELRRFSKINDITFGEAIVDSFIQNSSNMLGGIHNELTYMVMQAMSTAEIHDIAVDGYRFDFKFDVPNENFVQPDTGKMWFDTDGDANSSADVIEDFITFQNYYADTLSLGVDHWKLSKALLDKILQHPSVLTAYKASKNYNNPSNVKVNRSDVLAWMHDEMKIWPFQVIDFKSRHEVDGKPVADTPAFDEHNIVAAPRSYRIFEMKCMNSIYVDRVKMGGLSPSDRYSFVEDRITILNSWQERPMKNIVDCELYAGPVFNNMTDYGIATVWTEE